MKPQNTAIIGAGIVGLYLAWKLSEMGHKVVVFEKRPAIGKEACSGLFSERILGLIPQVQALVQNRLESVLIHFPKRTVKVKFKKPFLVMSHQELDRLVAGLAQKAGARIVLANPVSDLPPGFDRVIGCDGARSLVRKKLGLHDCACRLGILGFVPQEDNSSQAETWPVENGFIWRIPRGREVEYGIMAEAPQAKGLLEKFLLKNNLRIERPVSALIPQGFCLPENESVTLCGDAAGLTKPWSGGGVVWGLIGAGSLLKNFPNFLKYRHETKSCFLPKIALSKLATKTAYFLGFHLPYLLPKSFKIESDFLI